MSKRRIFLAGIFLTTLNSGALAEIPELEREALVDLYLATGGGEWSRNEG